MSKNTIAIVGAGLSGVYIAKRLARKLRRTDHQVLLFNDGSNAMTLQSVLPQIAVNTVPVESARYDLYLLFKNDKSVTFINQRVDDINFNKRILMTKKNDYHYDYLILAMGSIGSDFGIPGVAEHATLFNSFDGALAVRADLEEFLEQQKNNPEQSLNITVVGGGPSGVELMAELANFKNYHQIDPERITLTLVNASQVLLPALTEPELSQKAKDFLTRRGVEVLNDTRVLGMTKHRLTLLDGQQLLTDKVYWATGLQVEPISNRWGIAINDHGQLTVDKHFRVLTEEGVPLSNVFAAGNIAAFTQNNQEGLPQLALAAEYAGNIIINRLICQLGLAKDHGQSAKEQKNPGYFVSLGKNYGLSNAYGRNGSAGLVARWAKHAINLSFFAGIGSAYGFFRYFRYGRPKR
ncbi:NADH dehydrogenase-like protein YjlD [Fructobacillus sp. EFB-N1]|uniref:NAD(P)/FAD-dependent oxidoreductase n=1 Tax=Fructobacillus sp. EFB-N1 TaxID=1658766 RepID=UPI00064DD2A8|nr:FAD-dependent oxidoreductase [Fructobacillus sp. EFB-N1]KMK53366.1 NADH dehydrogenase-like protein YjlD [Fructobacillus sp. EFB-N1]